MTAEATLTLLGAIFVSFVAYSFEKRRDRFNKRRELRIQYLIDAYRSLEYAGNRSLSGETAATIERAIADIQLFGSPNQVRVAQAISVEFAKNGQACFDELLKDLRHDLRNELDLETVSYDVKHLRMELPSSSQVSFTRHHSGVGM